MSNFFKFFIKYFFGRFIVCLLVIFVGITITFLIPRLIPGASPAEVAVRRVQMAGSYLPPESVEKLRDELLKLYGLEGSMFQQYITYWQELLKGNLGPSFIFSTPVITLIIDHPPGRQGFSF